MRVYSTPIVNISSLKRGEKIHIYDLYTHTRTELYTRCYDIVSKKKKLTLQENEMFSKYIHTRLNERLLYGQKYRDDKCAIETALYRPYTKQ